jgi:hypothetical protein
MESGERDRKQAGVFHVINSSHSNLFRHGDSQFVERFQKMCRRKVIGANEPIGVELIQDFFDPSLVLGLDPALGGCGL